MKRKCHYCEATTSKTLTDFCEIGWEAISFNGGKAICACPNHLEQFGDDQFFKNFTEK